MTKTDYTLADTVVENKERYQALTIPLLSNKDRYTLSKVAYDVVSLVRE